MSEHYDAIISNIITKSQSVLYGKKNINLKTANNIAIPYNSNIIKSYVSDSLVFLPVKLLLELRYISDEYDECMVSYPENLTSLPPANKCDTRHQKRKYEKS